MNETIRVREVRVVGEDGAQLGIMPTSEALQLAEEHGLDLVEVAPNEKPPVCRIMDYGKYRYQQSKRLQQAKKKQKVILVKEIKLRPKTEEHDYQFKSQHDFFYTELGRRMLDRIVEDMGDISTVEQTPRQEGRNMSLVLSPRSA